MASLRTGHLFRLSLNVGAFQAIGRAPSGERVVGPVQDGSFEGERLRGSVLPNGADWITIRTDGAFQLDVRLVLKTDDDALIGMTYRGIRHGPPEVLARLARGESVDPSSYYLRIGGLFETAADRYAWLNKILFVGAGERKPSGPVYDVFEVQ